MYHMYMRMFKPMGIANRPLHILALEIQLGCLGMQPGQQASQRAFHILPIFWFLTHNIRPWRPAK